MTTPTPAADSSAPPEHRAASRVAVPHDGADGCGSTLFTMTRKLWPWEPAWSAVGIDPDGHYLSMHMPYTCPYCHRVLTWEEIQPMMYLSAER